MKLFPVALVVGIAAHFRALRADVVPARKLRTHAERGERPKHYIEILCLVELPLPRHEGEVEVAPIVPHGAAAGQPSCQQPARAFQRIDAALGKSVLIAPQHHGVGIVPKIQRRLPLRDAFKQRRFEGLIDKNVVARAFGKEENGWCHVNSI